MIGSKYAPFVGRILISILFIIAGADKVATPDGTMGYIASAGLPFPVLAYAGALAVELGGGLLLLIGYQTRWAALALAAFTIVAALIFHSNFADQIQMIMFLKNLAIIGGLLQIYAFGAGAFSLDARRGV
ncbi:MAG: DoxX family protein [Parvibaculum sp.]